MISNLKFIADFTLNNIGQTTLSLSDKSKKDGRYDVSELAEDQFEPRSKEQVLSNRLGIKSPKEMDDAEARALEKTMAMDVRHAFFHY